MYRKKGLFIYLMGVLVLGLSSCSTLATLPSNSGNSLVARNTQRIKTHQKTNEQKTNEQKAILTSSLQPIKIKLSPLRLQPNLDEVSRWSDEYETLREIENYRTDKIQSVIARAESFLGVRYRYGGTSRRGIDCSSFVQKAVKGFFPEFPRVSHAQAKRGKRISKNELSIGDLVYFATRGGRRVSHVGIIHHFDENNTPHFIHASSSQGVTVTSLRNSYWGARYLFGKRILTDDVLGVNRFNQEKEETVGFEKEEETADTLVFSNTIVPTPITLKETSNPITR